jgi:predicted ATP-dependent serine protease
MRSLRCMENQLNEINHQGFSGAAVPNANLGRDKIYLFNVFMLASLKFN